MRWEDNGDEDDVRVDSRTALAARGSLRHQWLVDPASLANQFAADPKDMILRLLREKGGAMTATRVREELVAFGLNEKEVEAAWVAAQRRFAKIGDVEAAGKGRTRTYKWVGQVAEPTEASDRTASNTSLDARETERADTTAATDEPSSSADDTAADEASAERPGTLADVLASALGDEPAHTINHHAQRPLQTGARLGRLGESVVAGLLASLTDQDRPQAVALFLAIPKRTEALDAPERLARLDPMAVDAVLASAAAEIQNDAECTSASRAPAGWLVRRASTIARPSAAAPLIELIAHVTGGQQPDVEALDIGARALSRLLPLLPPDARESINVEKLAGAVANLPLTAKGGRVALLSAVGKAQPESLTNEVWWRGASLQPLADCAAGILGGVTSLAAVAEQVIRPLVIKELSATTSRTRLSFLIGLPREFAAQLPTDAVAAAFRRTARQDPIVDAWVDALTDDGRADALKRDLEQALGDAATARERAKASERRAQELAERCDRLEEILRREHAQVVGLRASQERQIRIDVVRALADLAAEVEELAANHTGPDVLVERVRGLVAAQALEPIGVAGAGVVFDPTLHVPLVGAPEAGAAVSVIRPGYRWRSSGEDILIHKALVSAA